MLVAALVAALASAGLWQLDRLDQKRERNDLIAARSELPTADVVGLAGPDAYDAVEALEYRIVEATGSYLVDEEVLVRSRSLNGAPGSWVLTPLLLSDGTAVVVNRGWIPNSGELHAVPEQSRAPAGTVRVEGLVRPTETRGRFGPQDPSEGRLTDLARADLARLDQQVDADLRPFYVQMTAQDPAPDLSRAPKPLDAPAMDEGPHFSYAVQWFIFTTVALVGYPLILRKKARETAGEVQAPVSSAL